MSNITRRAAITGTAAAALIAGASLPAIGADHPDADLLALWRQWNALNDAQLTDRGGDDDVNNEPAMGPLAWAIAATPAKTTEGMAAKLHILAEYSDVGDALLSADGGEGVLSVQAFRSLLADMGASHV